MTRLLFIAFLANCIDMMMATCPTTCICIWKNGKETVECINRDLGEIPEGIEPSTQVIDLRGNSIPLLQEDVFSTLKITNLQKIFVQYCKIRNIEAGAFKALTNLVELDLGENLIQEVPSEALKETKALMRLNLSGNPIKHIRSRSFSNLPFLLTLELSHCRIEVIMDDAFLGLESLEWLKLEDNSLTQLGGEALFPRSLKGVELHNNPLVCDCTLQEFTRWLQLSAVPRVAEPQCLNPPRLKSMRSRISIGCKQGWLRQNRSIETLTEPELACPPTVVPVLMQLHSEQGRNISLRCKVSGIPEAVISWGETQRLLSNGSSVLNSWEADIYQVTEYYTESNTKVSELSILNIRQEDAGNYYCRKETHKEKIDTQESKQMFKVEYILGFGAAVVIVLTIIIVLILYLILQCKQKRRERQLRKLICDSRSSDSFAERSTVDYIVPGEMELMSAVRSVSCNSSMSKCNKTDGDEEEYGPNTESAPLTGDCPPPPPPPNGSSLSCSNPDLVQDTKLWERSSHKGPPPPMLDSYRPLNGSLGTGGSYAPHQYFPPRLVYPHNFLPSNPRLQFLPANTYRTGGPHQPHQGYLGPPQYRHPPPVQLHPQHRDIEDETVNETVLSAASLSSPMPHYYTTMPHCEGLIWSGPAHHLSYPHQIMGYRGQASQPFEHTKDCPRSSGHNMTGLYHHQPGQLQYPPGQDYHNQFSYGPSGPSGPPAYCPPPPPVWSAEEEEMKYGPFSDGEAETMRRGSRSCKKSGRGRGGTPHYATMSRVQEYNCRQQHQSSLESNEPSLKYTSQPQLNGNSGDFITSNRQQYNNFGSEALTPLSLKTSITFPRQGNRSLERPKSSLTRQDNVRSSYENGSAASNYPDLARHPLSYSVAPPVPPAVQARYRNFPPPGYSRQSNSQFPSHMTRSLGPAPRQNSSDDGHFEYEHSRSSSLGDIHWGMGHPATQEARMATPDGFKSLPYDTVKLAVNGVKRKTPRCGAIKIDLTCADKSIRRPGSAPDLVGGEEGAGQGQHSSPGGSSLRDNNKNTASFKDRARSTSSESRENTAPVRKPGVSPGTRKVAFAGLEDEETESESEKCPSVSVTSCDEEVWVKQPHDSVQTSGVVIAKAGPGPPPQNTKLLQQQNKCNGIR